MEGTFSRQELFYIMWNDLKYIKCITIDCTETMSVFFEVE